MTAAAEVALKHSGPKDRDDRYTIDGSVGLRRYHIYAVLANRAGKGKWQLVTEPSAGGVKASISVFEVGTVSNAYPASTDEQCIASIPRDRLLRARVDDVLGKRADRINCAGHAAELQKTATSREALGARCGSTSQGAAPPPAPLHATQLPERQ